MLEITFCFHGHLIKILFNGCLYCIPFSLRSYRGHSAFSELLWSGKSSLGWLASLPLATLSMLQSPGKSLLLPHDWRVQVLIRDHQFPLQNFENLLSKSATAGRQARAGSRGSTREGDELGVRRLRSSTVHPGQKASGQTAWASQKTESNFTYKVFSMDLEHIFMSSK